MNARPTIIEQPLGYFPLAKLHLSDRNVRKTDTGVDELVASIEAHGLLQNLTVMPNGSGYEVIVGGRRLRAMQLLEDEGRLPESLRQGIPCKLIQDDAIALEASTAENTLRQPMHPADQFIAFKAMVDGGEPIDDIAAHFGATPLFVRRMLKLANVNPQFVQIYREGGMKLDQLQALAITDDHQAQHEAWFGVRSDWERGSHHIRERLTAKAVRASRSLARFVSVEAYEAAGGEVRRDLFGSEEDAWLLDAQLLHRLALEKFGEVADAERAAGWSWVEAHPEFSDAELLEYPKLPVEPDFVLLPDAQARIDAIDKRIAEIDGFDADEVDDATAEKLQDELNALEIERDGIAETEIEVWPDDIKAQSGVLIFFSRDELRIERARLRPGEKVGKGGAIPGDAKPSKQAKAKTKPKADHNDAVRETLRAHLSEEVRASVMVNNRIALALMIDELHSWHVHDFGASGLLHFSHTSLGKNPTDAAPDLNKRTRKEIAECLGVLGNIPKKDRLGWLFKREESSLLELFAVLVGTRFNASSPRSDGALALLHADLGIQMDEVWTPACDNYLGRIPREIVLAAVAEARGKPAAAALASLKKDALIAEAGKQLAGTGWLPAPLRGPRYALGKPADAPATASKPVAKSKAKPVAKNAAKKKPAPKKAIAKKKPAKAANRKS